MTFPGLAVIGLTLAATSIACQPASQDAQALRQEIAALRNEVSGFKAELGRATLYPRWRIELRSDVRDDTYLLDTATGRVWRVHRSEVEGLLVGGDQSTGPASP